MHNAKSRAAMLLLALLLSLAPVPRASALQAGVPYSSIYVFGDGVCATNDPTATNDPLYYGKRNCNGRVWVEVLWKWQGLAYDEAKNISYFGHTSQDLLVNAANFTAADASTALFVIWCADADFVEFASLENLPPYTAGDLPAWTAFINSAVNRHVQAVTNLYDNKGAREVLMPNAVDIMAVPNYNATAAGDKAFVRARVMEFNAAFQTAMDNLAASRPGLAIYRPDTFGFFEQVLANPANYGLQNPYPNNSAVWDLANPNKQFGPGIDYVFWDDYHPTAKFQMQLAEFFKKAVLPVSVKSIAMNGSTVQLEVANIPLGRNGVVQGSAGMQPPWTDDVVVSEPFVVGGGTTKTYAFPGSGPRRFYRVGFPLVWTWP